MNNYENIPEELKEIGRFCGWDREMKDGKWKKVPKRLDRKNARENHPEDFCSFEEMRQHRQRFDGIAFLVESGLAAIDIDGCIEEGVLSDMAEDIIGIANTYTETSPSGTGVRIIGYAPGFAFDKEKYYFNNKQLHLEVYISGAIVHTASVTGNVLRDLPLRDISDVLPQILDRYMLRPSRRKRSTAIKPPGSFLTDEEIVEKASAAANGEKFRQLYGGDISGYESQSEADFALVSMLAFWCGGDEDQIDTLFRISGLMREKWDREDYRENTIRKAVDSVTDFYKPPEISSAEEDFSEADSSSPFPEEPIPLDGIKLPAFPADALPKDIGDYVLAVAESTQTPVDLAGGTALSVISVAMQGKYTVQPKPDWREPVNLFIDHVMESSERKSAAGSAAAKPLNLFEQKVNAIRAAEIDFSRRQKSILERRVKNLEEQVAKGKADMEELRKSSEALTDFKEVKPLRLYVDDVTTEKLVGIMSENDGRAAILSSEGGIFDLLKGIYTRYVNIDVFLKGYSGDPIRVDRVGRDSETIYNPVLTVSLMTQPSVLADIMGNGNFRGRGLLARFLYIVPESLVGKRRYRSEPIPDDVYRRYEECIVNILEDEPENSPEVITFSPEADALLEAFSDELEPKLKTEYADYADWAGKLVGNVARIAALLCRAEVRICREFLAVPEHLEVNGRTMENAIRLGRYFIEHARAAFSLLGADKSIRNCKYVLSAIKKAGLAECSRRDIMRLCRAFKTKDAVQPVIEQLVEYGYLAPKPPGNSTGKGRTQTGVYLVNPSVYSGK